MTVYDVLGVPYFFTIQRKNHGVYYVLLDGHFLSSADSRREADNEIQDYITENGLVDFVPV